jgi:predicted DNA-binding protein
MADRSKKRSSRVATSWGPTESEPETLQTAVRLPRAAVERVKKLAKRMSQPGVTISRSEAIRVALIAGLDALDAAAAANAS